MGRRLEDTAAEMFVSTDNNKDADNSLKNHTQNSLVLFL